MSVILPVTFAVEILTSRSLPSSFTPPVFLSIIDCQRLASESSFIQPNNPELNIGWHKYVLAA